MTRYDYECPKCGVFEVSQSMKDDALDACPTCGEGVKRLISGGALTIRRIVDDDSYWTPGRRRAQQINNQGIADAIANGAPISDTERNPSTGEKQQVPREFTRDLEDRIAAATGRTRLGH